MFCFLSLQKIKKNGSFKVDYTIFTKTNKVYFVELKTDNGSIRPDQINYYLKSLEFTFDELLTGVLDLNKATKNNSKSKYSALIEKLVKTGCIDKLTLKPSGRFQLIKRPIIIKPNHGEKDPDNFTIVSFDSIIKIIKKQNDDLAPIFIKSLTNWSK